MRGVASRSPSTAGLRAALLIALAAAALLLAVPPKQGLAANNTITQPDSGGQYTSIALDASGFPVISHYDPASGDLKTVHCGNAACSSGNTLASPDTTNDVGKYSSLKLDASGNPVVSYFDYDLKDLKLLHCGNANCTASNTTTSADPTYNTGFYSSLALDASGNPVVSYHETPHDVLKVLRCNNPTCTSYGSTFADPGSILGQYTSIALDASSFPVVSYYDETTGDLKVIHCGNATCTSGNTITSPDSAGEVGKYTSIALDTSGNPVVSYYDQSGGDLKVLHCGNQNCTSGTIKSPDTTGDVGRYSSIRLDGSGHPVVSYYDASGANLRVLHCGDSTCASGNVTMTPDSTGDVGQYTSLALDASGYPVVSYYDATNGLLKVLHCGDPACSAPSTPTPTPMSPPTPTPVSVGGFTMLPNVARPGGGNGGAVALILMGALVVLAAGVAGRLAWRRTRA